MKEIHVNAYTKSDGTHVKEHYRTIESNGNTTTPQNQSQNFNSNPVLTGGVSIDVDARDILQGGISSGGIDWGSIGSAIGKVAIVAVNVAAKAAPIALQMYQAVQSSNGSAIQYLKPQFDNSIKSLEETQKVIKQNLDNNLNKLTTAKNQDEYANLYKSFVKENEIYKRTADAITRIKYAAENQDYETVVNELNNYKNLQNSVISDSFMNNQVDLNKRQAGKNTQQYKPDFSSMNYAPVPSPYMNANTQPDYGLNKNIEDYIKNSPQLMKEIIDEKLNFIDNKTAYKVVHDGTEFWNAASQGIENNDYMKNNGVQIKNVHEIPSHELQITIASKLQTQGLSIDNTKGIIFFEDSDISKSIANSAKFKDLIKSNKEKLLCGKVLHKESINYAKLNPNLWGALGKVDVIKTYIDENGNLISTIIDTYEFNQDDKRKLIQMGRSAQDAGLIETFFVVIPIKIPYKIWSKWK